MLILADSTFLLVQTLWDYLQLNQAPRRTESMIVMGCHDLGVAHRAIELYHQGFSDYMVLSGGKGKITQHLWHKSEAEMFADLALQAGIKPAAIILETRSQNCAENLLFSMQLLAQKGLSTHLPLLITKPYLERRVYATFKQHFPNIAPHVSSLQLALDVYLRQQADIERVINLMVGDLQRIMLYPQKGWQIPQQVPDPVLQAYHQLLALGFTQQLIR